MMNDNPYEKQAEAWNEGYLTGYERGNLNGKNEQAQDKAKAWDDGYWKGKRAANNENITRKQVIDWLQNERELIANTTNNEIWAIKKLDSLDMCIETLQH